MLASCIPAVLILGIWIGRRKYRPPTDEQVRRYMDRVVNVEAIEEHERLLKVRMARQGRKSTRTDGGPNAKIMRMRIRPRPKKER